MVTKCLEKIQTYISNIRQYHKKNLKVLTGAEGNILSKSLTSLELSLWALKRLDKITQVYDYKSTNMLSLMTLSVEHLHATSHIKQPLMTQLQYTRDFMPTLNESIKRSSNWSAFCFTSRKGSWYPPTQNTICLNTFWRTFQKSKTSRKLPKTNSKHHRAGLWPTLERFVREL